jgi:hypothetical protein
MNAKDTAMGDRGRCSRGIALQRDAVIRPLAEYSRLSVDDIAGAASQLGLSRTVLYKLLQRYRRRRQTQSHWRNPLCVAYAPRHSVRALNTKTL